MTTTTSSAANGHFGQILRTGALTTATALLVNGLLFTISNLPTEVPLPAVLSMTFIGGVAAIIGYALLNRFLTQKTTNRVMLIGVACVLAGFAFNPFTIPNVSITTIVILQLMHVAAALPAMRLAL